MTLDQRALI